MVSTVKKLSNGYGYKYAELSTIHEELERQKITYYQYIEYDQNADADYICTVLCIDGKDLEPRRGCRVIYGDEKMKTQAQAQGSGLTYARRYSLLMALGWATEDDDGNTAGKASAQKSNKLDFKDVRKRLNEITNVDELNNYWRELKLTEKQAEVLKTDFTKRKTEIGVGVGV